VSEPQARGMGSTDNRQERRQEGPASEHGGRAISRPARAGAEPAARSNRPQREVR
jgi:hypothetical protein